MNIIKQDSCSVNLNSLENIPYYRYPYGPTKLPVEFTMTRALMQAKSDGDKTILIQTKFLLACLINAALKTGKYSRLLTSTRRLCEHFKMYPYSQKDSRNKTIKTHVQKIQRLNGNDGIRNSHMTPHTMQKILRTLQTTYIQGVPLIICRKYDPEAVDALQAPCEPTAEKESEEKAVYYKKQNKERLFEILIPSYSLLKYTGEDDDFFFDVHLELYAKELPLTERVVLFMCQSLSNLTAQKSKNASFDACINTKKLCERLGFQLRWVQNALNTLCDKNYLLWTVENGNTYMILDKLGVRKPKRFLEGGSATLYKRQKGVPKNRHPKT